MRTTLLTGLSALALTTFFAAPAAAAELGGGFSINGSAAVVSDYRFRGISQSNKNFAVQGGITVSHESGLYATVWGSTIDDYVTSGLFVGNGADVELDLIAGYKHDFGGTVLDVGVLYYYYPGSETFIPYNSDFIEPYVSLSHTFGPVTAKASAAYAPKQKALTLCQPAFCGKQDQLYIAGDLSVAIPGTPVTATGHIGHTFGPSWLVPVGKEYTDWSLGLSYTTGPVTLGVSYVDTDTIFVPFNKDVAKAGVVGTLSVSF